MTEHQFDEGLVEIDGRDHYVIPGVDRMPPFLMVIVSDGDRWMFVSSTGALTAGRVDAANSLFPYETEDRMHAAAGHVGPVTRLRVGTAEDAVEWTPFAVPAQSGVRRTLAKTVTGDSVEFEETLAGVGLTFGYRWNTSAEHGFIRTSSLVNNGTEAVRVEILDGLLGILPHGLDPGVHLRLSNLTHAYKRSEVVDRPSRLAVYSLEAPVSDSADPAEVLRASAVWSCGLDGAAISLDASALRSFEVGRDDHSASVVTGRPGAYLLRHQVELTPGQVMSWRIVADVALDQFDLTELREQLRTGALPGERLDEAIRNTADELVGMMAGADALQRTDDPVMCAHHYANVTFNVMRGGIPRDGYRVDTADFARFLGERNRRVAHRHRAWLRGLPPELDRRDLLGRIETVGDRHLSRLGREYLPFSFSRRHGDPSRPWNAFSIRTHDEDGNPVIRFEGNWRDVFQNWEALCHSFPEYLPGVITAFVNASTADGYNPYRVTREGIDWEVPDPDDPWANIGYWGDHQIVYLLRLLRASDAFLPGVIDGLLHERSFTYADVPYRIADHDDIVDDPKATITFDERAHAAADARVGELGGDGRLLLGSDGEPVAASLLEKLLVSALAKLTNFVPFGGIWMNTQRPEWNDANNALVGHGLSVVTLVHLREFLDHVRVAVASGPAGADMAVEVASWLDDITAALRASSIVPPPAELGHHRRAMLDHLGRAGSRYRNGVYENGLSGATRTVDTAAIRAFCDLAIDHLDASIRASARDDKLVHSYNLLAFSADGRSATVTNLPEMLEGQVAALGSAVFDAREKAELIDALFSSALYRSDQDTFVLAPARVLPSFLDKNVIPDTAVETNELLSGLLAVGDRSLVERDVTGRTRFCADLTDAAALESALDRLAGSDDWADLVARYRGATLRTYEDVFGHHGFLGRSVAMYAYEGIGSIYWHMVTKLLLAIHDAVSAAAEAGDDPEVITRLAHGYERVRAGLGFNKRALDFGAVPTDPYSHTPSHAGAQQPGLTGAVKEELLVRPRELGVSVRDGELVFDPLLLRSSEVLREPAEWEVVTTSGHRELVHLPAGSMGLTVCQVPVIVSPTAGEASTEADLLGGGTTHRVGGRLGRDVSAKVFARTGEVTRIRVALPSRR